MNLSGWGSVSFFKESLFIDQAEEIPINGTSNNRIIDTTKKIIEILKRFTWLIDEKIKMQNMPIQRKIKCLKKKE